MTYVLNAVVRTTKCQMRAYRLLQLASICVFQVKASSLVKYNESIDLNSTQVDHHTHDVSLEPIHTLEAEVYGMICPCAAEIRQEKLVANTLLSELFNNLKSFIRGNTFDAPGLLRLIPTLEDDIARIEIFIMGIFPAQLELTHKFAYLHRMYRSMVHSAKKLREYSLQKGSAQSLIFKMIQLNVRLLVLRDAHGVPDSLIENYYGTVKYFKRILPIWRRMFERALDRLLVFERMFNAQMSLAETSLNYYESYVTS